MKKYYFKTTKKSKTTNARTGELYLPHGIVETPCFMPDATYAYIKALPYFVYNLINTHTSTKYSKMVVINTLHSYINIPQDILKETGGLNNFINNKSCILTDSGGFQVYSLGIKLGAPINKKGITFKNPKNGDTLHYSPEIAMKTQNLLKSDIRVALDYFTDPSSKEGDIRKSVEITTLWAQISKKLWEKGDKQSLIMAVVQGDTNLKMREKSYNELNSIGFDGFGFGGWPLTEDKKLDIKTLNHFCELIQPNSKITPFRYAMGIGTPEDIEKCIDMGFDLFDTVLPTRNARHGYLFASTETVRINSSKYKKDYKSIDPNCNCITCQNYSRAYLHYLFKLKSDFGYTLATIHNIAYFEKVIEKCKDKIN